MVFLLRTIDYEDLKIKYYSFKKLRIFKSLINYKVLLRKISVFPSLNSPNSLALN